MDNNDSKQVAEIHQLKLTGRIYPAVQNCVNNRYKIIGGYFAIVGFLLLNEDVLNTFLAYKGECWLAIIFWFFAAHNTYNYFRNAKEQEKIEEQYKTQKDLENEKKDKNNRLYKKTIKQGHHKTYNLIMIIQRVEVLAFLLMSLLIFLGSWLLTIFNEETIGYIKIIFPDSF